MLTTPMSGPELSAYRRAKKVRQDDKTFLAAIGLQMAELSAIERGRLPMPYGFAERFIETVDRYAAEREGAAA